jgi:TPR repeat protein
MYENGRGVAKDEAEAVRWYRKVIDQEDATAQYKGVMYENARSAAKDEAQAVPVKPDDSGAPADMVENEEEDISAEPDSDFDAGTSTEERLSARTVETKTGAARKFIIGIVLVGLAVYAFNTYVQASFDLGESYYKARNYPAAVEQFRMAAYLGNTDAQLKLGAMYEDGRGVEQDKEEAVEWYQKAADQGDAAAQFVLGMKYYAGEGVEKDVTEACRWFRKAADQGDALAQYALGMRHYAGEGVEKDDTQAYMWVILALSNTAQVSPDYLPRVEFRDSLAARLTSGQKDEARRLVLEWQKQHAP